MKRRFPLSFFEAFETAVLAAVLPSLRAAFDQALRMALRMALVEPFLPSLGVAFGVAFGVAGLAPFGKAHEVTFGESFFAAPRLSLGEALRTAFLDAAGMAVCQSQRMSGGVTLGMTLGAPVSEAGGVTVRVAGFPRPIAVGRRLLEHFGYRRVERPSKLFLERHDR